MNTSTFMDKQIMDLKTSQTKDNNNNNDSSSFMDLNNYPSLDENIHHHHDVDDNKKDEILPSYDFQPIRPVTSSPARPWGSADLSNTNFASRSYGSLNSVEPTSKVHVEKDRTVLDAALISEIDRTMKTHADNLMHELERVSARLSQLESRSRNLENSVDDLRTSVGNNHGNTDGKLRQIENIVREVQAGVQDVKDKQEILETQLQLSQVQISKPQQQPLPQPQMAAASAPSQSHQQFPPAPLPQPPQPTLPNAPPPPPVQHPNTPPPPPVQHPNAPPPPPPVQHPNQYPQSMPMQASHHDSYYPPSGQTAEPLPQQYQMPPPQQPHPPKMSPPSPQPQYQATHTQYSQPPPMSLQQPNPPQNQPPLSHHSEELAYLSSQNYPPSIRQPGGGPPTPQQFHGNPSQMYEPPPGRTGSGFSSQYGPSSGFGEPFNYGDSQYGSPRKSQQHSPPNMGSGGPSGYPQLPTARILPQSLPTAAAVGGSGGGSSSSSGSGGNRVPIDDVVDKVTNMGFPRDQVRATVRKLTENGQAVDLNVVLDKLMTDGVESQNPRPWFGR